MMMKGILVLAILIFTLGCAGTKYKVNLTEEEVAKFSYDREFIYYEGQPVAKFNYIEYEYYKGHKVLEISFEQLKPGLDDFTDKIVEFVRYKNPKAKVEVKIPQFPFESEVSE